MTKAFFRKSWISFVSFLSGIGIILACSGDFWEEWGNSNFTPEAFVDKKYSPFFYSWQFYYGINHDEKHNGRFNSQVVEDWNNYLEKKATQEELEYLLFRTRATGIDSLIKGLKDESFINPLAKTYTFLKDKKNKKLSSFLNYLRIAKECENFALADPNENWENSEKSYQRKSSKELCALVKSEYGSAKDKFIKERLWFQLVRAYYFNGDYSNCISIFETQLNSAVKNTIYYRSMAYAAGAYYKTKNYSKSNYYYSLVFDSGDEMKTVAHWSFRPQEEKDWNATLTLCKSNSEKITLWQMLGVFYDDEMRSIQEIYKLDPSSEKLELLLARLVNKLENEAFDFSAKNKKPENYLSIKTERVKRFITGIPSNKNLSKPYMWQMALGYLNIMDRNFTGASNAFDEAEKTIPNEELAKGQLRLLKLINKVSSLQKISSASENELVTEIGWLKTLQAGDAKLRVQETWSWLLLSMANKYRAQGDLLKSEFFKTTSDYYVNDKQLQDMKAFLKKANKTAYEELCQGIYKLNHDDLVEFEAIFKFYSNKTEEAIALMEQSGDHVKILLPSNPFNGGIKDCHDCDHSMPQKVKYTKLSFLKKVKELKDKMGTDQYNNALLLGNAFYNATFYGSSRKFYQCNVIGREYSEREYMDDTFRDKLLDISLAKTYYTIAFGAAKTDEQKAKCVYMLSKCERNEWYTRGEGPKEGVAFIAWNNFKLLKNYSKTKYYNEVIKECGYFRSYSGD